MYTSEIFENKNLKLIREFIRETAFATLISRGDGYPSATHIPLELRRNKNKEEILTGHMSKANPHWHEFKSNPKVLAIFLSPIHGFVSSSWYEKPDAPTWNYMSAHVSGKIKLLTQDETETSLSQLIDKYESKMDHPVSWNSLSDDVKKQAKNIVGFEISIDRMEAVFKLSQNRSKEDHARIIERLCLSET